VKQVIAWTLLVMLCGAGVAAAAPEATVPGVVIDHIAAARGIYVGSPSIVVMPNGSYLASHDEFGPKSQYHGEAVTRVFRSEDRGANWKEISKIEGCLWASLFLHNDALYLWGTNREYGDMLIRRSTDGGRTWTQPKDENSGLLFKGRYHTAPVPVVVHGGRVWRAWEEAEAGKKWGENFRPFVMSAAEDADLLRAASWTRTNALGHESAWLGGKFTGWLEGNAVVTPEGKIVDILRVDFKPEGGTAAIVRISDDGKKATFDPEKDFVKFPGGAKKFTIRFDSETKRYWSLSNYVPPEFRNPNPAATRNTLALVSSANLRDWKVERIVLQHPDRAKHGFQYVDWRFDGDDLVAAVRTAYDDGEGGAHNMHDANYMIFYRVKGFRKGAR
jgi:hypothetical protein